MILDLSTLVAALDRHSEALLTHAKAIAGEAVAAVEGAVKRGRGRPAKDDPPAITANNPTPPSAAVTLNAPAAATATPATTEEKPAQSVPTLQQVADAIIDLANNVSRDAAVGVLTAHNVKKVPELKPDQFASVLKAVAAAKAPAGANGLT